MDRSWGSGTPFTKVHRADRSRSRLTQFLGCHRATPTQNVKVGSLLPRGAQVLHCDTRDDDGALWDRSDGAGGVLMDGPL